MRERRELTEASSEAMGRRTEIGVMQPQAEDPWSPQELGEAGRSLPWSLGVLGAALIFRLWPPGPQENSLPQLQAAHPPRVGNPGPWSGVGLGNPSPRGPPVLAGAHGSRAAGFQPPPSEEARHASWEMGAPTGVSAGETEARSAAQVGGQNAAALCGGGRRVRRPGVAA